MIELLKANLAHWSELQASCIASYGREDELTRYYADKANKCQSALYLVEDCISEGVCMPSEFM